MSKRRSGLSAQVIIIATWFTPWDMIVGYIVSLLLNLPTSRSRSIA